MTISQDTDAILSVWGSVGTLVRKSATFSDTGKDTSGWATMASPRVDIQASGGQASRSPGGEVILTTHVLIFPAGTDVRGNDRFQPSGWVAGDDEHDIIGVSIETDHVSATSVMVRGHGG